MKVTFLSVVMPAVLALWEVVLLWGRFSFVCIVLAEIIHYTE